MSDPRQERVYIAKVKTGYQDHAALVEAIGKGIDWVGWKPPERLLGRADWAFASAAAGSSVYARPELVRAALEAIFQRNEEAGMKLVARA
ncbi:MAG TPA: hypothetical protein VHF22_12245, partial [Planctomycetota bacterium]|nr:hypothetical protein [Planctomycetota bacterium]